MYFLTIGSAFGGKSKTSHYWENLVQKSISLKASVTFFNSNFQEKNNTNQNRSVTLRH